MADKFILHPEEFGRALIPRRFRPKLRRYLFKAGYTEVPYSFYGYLFYFSIVLTYILLMIFFIPKISSFNPASQMILVFMFWFIVQLAIVTILISLTYIYYDLKITNRTRQMDDVIEDFLRYVSENLKGGMSFEKALWSAIRPKFGILAQEIRLVAKKVMTGQDIEDALLEFSDKYDSPLLKRSFQLIIEGLKGGGRISDIIDKTEENIRETKELKREMVTTNTTYIIFLNFIILVIAPVLFALSFSLVRILKNLATKLSFSGASTTNSMFTLDLSSLNQNPMLEQNFMNFSMGALLIISVSTAMIVSIIKNGNIKEGLKYVPVYVVISIFMYLLFKAVFVGIFGSIM